MRYTMPLVTNYSDNVLLNQKGRSGMTCLLFMLCHSFHSGIIILWQNHVLLAEEPYYDFVTILCHRKMGCIALSGKTFTIKPRQNDGEENVKTPYTPQQAQIFQIIKANIYSMYKKIYNLPLKSV